MYMNGNNVPDVSENYEEKNVVAVSYTHLTLPTMAVV